MMKHVLKHIVILFTSSVLVACAGTPEEPRSLAEPAASRYSDCISQMSIRDYNVLDEANLIVTGPGKRSYHVVLARRAFGLRSTWRIGFKSPTGGMICPGSSELIVDDGLNVDTFRVRSIRKLTPDDRDELLVRFGKKEPDMQQTPEPHDVEGAEVEELD